MASVLLAEDDVTLRGLVATALRGAGHDVVEVGDGAEALEYVGDVLERDLAELRAPDVVISDVHMPHLTGLHVAASLRGTRPAIPTILITAFGDVDSHAMAKRVGAVAMLDKPFDLDALRDVVEMAVTAHARAPRVLVVDDRVATASALTGILRDDGATCQLATTPEAALDAVARESFDVVVLDTETRGRAGVVLLAQLRVHVPDLAAIVLSSQHVRNSQVEALLDAGAAYLAKPVDVARLVALVRWLVVERREAGAATPVRAGVRAEEVER
jgi:DNA-binding NtrC family response regulator|nr:response regulator [Kofleriaceae bacterium]